MRTLFFHTISAMSTPRKSTLRPLDRYVTTHDSSGKGVFSNKFPSAVAVREILDGVAKFSLVYTSDSFPVDMNEDKDLQGYASSLSTPPALMISGGTVCRVVDFAPGYLSAMHGTVSCDFGVVLEGEVELVLDSGETRLLKHEDVAVQRGTNHAWRNTSFEYWCRMLFVLQAAEPVLVGGKPLVEDERGIPR